jgi:hypothetical protein
MRAKDLKYLLFHILYPIQDLLHLPTQPITRWINSIYMRKIQQENLDNINKKIEQKNRDIARYLK